jgi:Na+-transporting NADH:ubiquinone oxidoreductase subunit NqrC
MSLLTPRFRGRASTLTLIIIMTLLWLSLFSARPVQAQSATLDAQTQALVVDAVEAAFELDLYNQRCRQDRSGRRTENLNKTLASGLRMTVLDVQDDLFPEQDYRAAQARMTDAFLARLREMGGCTGAKQARLRDLLRERYEQAIAALEAFP